MDIKQEIEKLLDILKKAGIDRRHIEKDLIYSEGYIDQLLSKGGNKKFLNLLAKYKIEKSNKSSDHIDRLLAMLEKEQDNVKEAHDIIKLLSDKVPKAPDINESSKNGSNSQKTSNNLKQLK